MNTKIAFTLVAALSFGAQVIAQVPISKNGYAAKIGAPKRGVTAQDANFIKAAAAGNLFEVKSSELALKNGSSSFVKQFAKEMIADHSAAYEELKLVAKKSGKTAPKMLMPKQEATLAKLSKLRGAAFDAAYQKAQKDAHMETVMVLKKQIQKGNDSNIKNYAITTLPTVEMHAKMLMTKTTMTGAHKMHHGM